jgi:hypothetical protein
MGIGRVCGDDSFYHAVYIMSTNAIASYNSDKVQLQDSITQVYKSIQDNQNTSLQYKDIEDETNRLSYRQEAVYNMVSTLALLSVLFTVHRLS